ncbi:molybdopterin biosynthesis protein [Cellulosilyticum sp. I15G10I2]|uniref:molybdopterin biosynthesis protein n=1 Tax=Cellulosilyticum sp. I15G10I2 TaxID=1892843 RepID=UPI00085BBEDE|nr:molybdopterin biosynthesis protein [Cellulosilyticum sp. I15G10I2]
MEKYKDNRNIYISNIPVEEAIERYKNALASHIKTETLPVEDALFRTTCEAVFANISSPHYHGAAMDGIAVTATDTYGACEKAPKVLIQGEHFEYVNTGNPIPVNRDAVIMIEDLTEMSPGHVQIIAPAYPWQHIRTVGEDIVQGEMIIPSFHTIRPMDMGALLNGGVEQVQVFAKTSVGILPTGTEIVQNVKELKYGKIIDSNSKVFQGLILEAGGIPKIYAPLRDDKEVLKAAIKKGIAENDILIINAGSSAGSKDFTVDLIRELGEVIIHGVALKPGKPTILGIIDGKPVIGIPGYPVSAYFAFETFAKPIIAWYLGKKDQAKSIKAVLSQRVVSSLKHQELVRVTLGEVDNRLVATPLNRGAGATMSLVRADGVLTIPRMSEGIESGQMVDISLIKPIEKIIKRVVLIGSHDLILDLIADRMPLTSGHVGSLGGIMSMKRRECHIAPIHLLDEHTGEYNISYVKKYFSAGSMAIIKGVKRLQGLMIQKGNPKQIKGFSDLIRDDIHFVNRQRGAGTRQLLDYELKKQQLDPGDIIGYNREMTTHMTVAVTIASGTADAGLGIFAAAEAMKLDFIPACYEAYDFLVPIAYLEDHRVQNFIEILKSKTFKEKLSLIGGYELENPGEVLKVGE